MSPERPYITITGDTHAGAAIDMYRDYLEPAWRAEFDAWRGAYRNPSKKLLGTKKTKNWDSAERRADLESDGVVAEVIFPNTVPPFYGKAYHVSPLATPEQYPRWLAGTRAHRICCGESVQQQLFFGVLWLAALSIEVKISSS